MKRLLIVIKNLGLEPQVRTARNSLCPYDSCRLTVFNLYGYVVNPFTENAYFDWDVFKKDVIKAQRYMDDIIDLEIEKLIKLLKN